MLLRVSSGRFRRRFLVMTNIVSRAPAYQIVSYGRTIRVGMRWQAIMHSKALKIESVFKKQGAPCIVCCGLEAMSCCYICANAPPCAWIERL